MKHLIITSILIFIFVFKVKADVDYQPDGCSGTTGCWRYCEGHFGTCPSGFKQIIEDDAKGDSNLCYCYRPYTKEELKKKNAGQCERYINQCFSLSNSNTSCGNVFKFCGKNKKKVFCYIMYEKYETLKKNSKKKMNKYPGGIIGYNCVTDRMYPSHPTFDKNNTITMDDVMNF